MRAEDIEDIYELSPLQQGMLFLSVRSAEPGVYSVQFSCTIDAPLDVAAFRRAWESALQRHAVLRSDFHWDDLEKPFQVVHRAVGMPWSEQDWRGLDNVSERRESFAASDRTGTFDLAVAPPMRFTLIRVKDGEWVFFWTFHHILLDGWSLGLVMHDVLTAYKAQNHGKEVRLDPAPLYRDYIAWLQEQSEAEAKSFWQPMLKGFAAPTPIRLGGVGPHEGKQEFGREESCFTAEQTARLQAFARANQLTVNTIVQAAWGLLLSRYSGEEDVMWGTVVSGRPASLVDADQTCGLFINTLPVRTQVPGEARVIEWLRQQQTLQVELRQFEYSSLVQIQSWSEVPRPLPLFESILIFENFPVEGALRDTPAVHIREPKLTQRPTDALSVVVIPGEKLQIDIVYDGGRFSKAAIQRTLQHLRNVISGIVAHPQSSIRDIPWLSEGEQQQELRVWNDTETVFPHDCGVHELFEQRALSSPDSVAINGDSGRITYRELNEYANRIAHRLQRAGATKGSFVAIAVERSVAMIAAMIAVLKCGAVYVPIDVENPRERIAFMLADSRAVLLLAWDSTLAQLLADQSVFIDLNEEDFTQESAGNLDVRVSGEDLIYLMYTSGSTGQPKGAMIPHRAVARLVRATNYIEITPGDRIAQASNASFDAATFEIWGALTNGAALVLLPKQSMLDTQRFAAALEQHQVSILFLTTALLNQFAQETPWAFRSLKYLLFGGEAVDPRWVRKILTHDAPEHLLHVYGPTETTTFASFHEVRDVPESAATIPIGLPISNTGMVLLDQQLRPVPAGTPGEIFISGVGLAAGYHNQPELTREKFLTLDVLQGRRAYRTGDVGRRREDGSIEFFGRTDDQVKLRGFRIELGEIEAVLRRHPALADAVVVVREDRAGDRRLVAYVAPAGRHQPAANELRQYVRAHLPHYMVPAAFVSIETLPLNVNGKVDRKALRSPQLEDDVKPLATGPSTELENVITGIWQDVLGVHQPDVNANFFDLGGHSLSIMRVYSELKKVAGKPISIVDLFTYPTISTLAGFLGNDEKRAGASDPGRDPDHHVESREPIAIIGMAGRFPGAGSVDELWNNLRNGVESISFFSDEEMMAAGVDPATFKHPQYVKAGTVLEGADLFDAQFFGFNAREAEATDPQQRIFLECAHNSIENAGYDPRSFAGSIGVFAGASMSTYLLNCLMPNLSALAGLSPLQMLIGNDKDFLATRVSYKLNLRGPSINVQSACSTSLVAVHLACESLLSSQCDLAIAGGVSVLFPQQTGYQYHAEGILSPDGHCRPFDASSRGTIAGSGVATVVLKRLSRALADGDTIHAVIRGSAINNDGSLKAGYTAPSVEGQAEVIAAAIKNANVDPETISYVEAHGTGTELGDPIEIAALTKAFGRRQTKCAIGSLKSNVGHLDAAAGVAGLIKAALQLRYRELTPSLHFQSPNPNADFRSFCVQTELSPWRAGAHPLRAGVSSFGIGGTNAHVILEEAPQPAPVLAKSGLQVATLSAKSEAALDSLSLRIAEYLDQSPEGDIGDIAWTLQEGRTAHVYRRSIVAGSTSELSQALRTGHGAQAIASSSEPAVVLLFSGQGSQHPGMGRGLYDAEPVFRAEFERCSRLFETELGYDLKDIVFDGDESGGKLSQTGLTQPALFALEWALAQLWLSWGIRPRAMLGHSIGEYVAATLAGVFSLEDAVRIVSARGSLMESVAEGAMLAVSLSEGDLVAILPQSLSIAAVNAPALCAVSGTLDAIAEFEDYLSGRDISYKRLRTSRAFHSPMMEGILDRFRSVVASASLQKPVIPFISNVSGTWIRDQEATSPEYWTRHLRQPVRFSDGISVLGQFPTAVLIEVGPGQALTAMARQQCEQPGHSVVASMPRAGASDQESRTILDALGKLWIRGVAVNWRGLHRNQSRRRIPLPTYPFERQRFWIGGRSVASPEVPERRSDPAEWLYVPSWKRSPLPAKIDGASAPQAGTQWLILANATGLGERIAKPLERLGATCTVRHANSSVGPASLNGHISFDPFSATAIDAIIADLVRQGRVPQYIVNCIEAGPEGSSNAGFYSLLYLAQALGKHAVSSPIEIIALTSGADEVTGTEIIIPERATIAGPCTVIPQEYQKITVRRIDLPQPENSNLDRLVRLLIPELLNTAAQPVTAIRGEYSWVRSFDRIPLPKCTGRPDILRQGGTYLITGGLSGIGLEIAEHLARGTQANLVLVGRTGVPDNWEKSDAHPAASRLRNMLEVGAQVLPLRANVADLREMSEAVAAAEARFGRIDGVIHSAGVAGGGLIELKDRDVVEAVFAPKIRGTRVLESVFRERGLDFFVLCSSLAAQLGGYGQVDYCGANAFLDAFAAARPLGALTPVISINWDTWRETGMAVTTALPKDFERGRRQNLSAGIGNREGIDAFDRILNSSLVQVLVSTGDLDHRIQNSAKFVSTDVLDRIIPAAARHQRPNLPVRYTPARQEIDQALIRIWEELLGITPIGIHDDFLELGGHSLMATQVTSRIHEDFDTQISLRTFLANPTIASLSSALLESESVPGQTARIAEALAAIEAMSGEEIDAALDERGIRVN